MSIWIIVGIYFFSTGSSKVDVWPQFFRTVTECQSAPILKTQREKLDALDAVSAYALDCVEVPIAGNAPIIKPELKETPKSRQEKLPKLTT